MSRLNFRKYIRLPHDAYYQGNAFFITVLTHEKYSWFGMYPELARIAVEQLCCIAEERAAKLFAWCVMPDHIHMLLLDKNIIDFVRFYKGRMNPQARAYEKERLFWQRSFYDHGLRKDEALNDISMYIWQNPARAGLASDFADYPWSGSAVWPEWRSFGDF